MGHCHSKASALELARLCKVMSCKVLVQHSVPSINCNCSASLAAALQPLCRVDMMHPYSCEVMPWFGFALCQALHDMRPCTWEPPASCPTMNKLFLNKDFAMLHAIKPQLQLIHLLQLIM